MSNPIVAPVRYKHAYDNGTKGYIFDEALKTGVTISTVDAVSVSPSGLTIASETVNASAFDDDDGNEVAIGKAVLATESGGSAGETYRVTVKVTLSDGTKLAGIFPVEVVE